MRKHALAILQLTIALLLGACGCSDPSPATVAGAYRRNTATFREKIRLHPDGTFTQEVMTQDGAPKLLTSGKWTFEYGQVSLHNFYITYDLDHREEMKNPELVTSASLACSNGWLVLREAGPYAFEKDK